MKYYIVHTQQTETGETHEKLISSAHYQLSAEYLLEQMEAQPDKFDFLVVPFILALGAGLEANLNDWLIVDTFAKHGSEQYKPLVEGYTGASFGRKLRIVVAILTDNTFQLREDSPVIQQLDKLIATRNKITHPMAHYHVEVQSETERKSHSDKLTNHPLHTLTLEDCRRYYEAVVEFDRGIFQQYDNKYIVENDLIRELKKVGEQVADEEEK